MSGTSFLINTEEKHSNNKAAIKTPKRLAMPGREIKIGQKESIDFAFSIKNIFLFFAVVKSMFHISQKQ
ncbi:hypothetical protein AU500_09395 [Lonsdalea populi]|nr:hypothetical protein AU499_01535 [Lonsdalea populi]RAT47129.1 hypothetical protein AU494_02295 [Lonsdalea populi]RAT47699.1 hypothetical protein AU495_00580 [Lonsdalea populi]RAT56708.1 hypothetical protein AU500_09395 [Lonsdalea populi]RAT63136.1 hypothetical protein AU501_03590 [Lonsdalea populi]